MKIWARHVFSFFCRLVVFVRMAGLVKMQSSGDAVVVYVDAPLPAFLLLTT